MLAGIIFVVAYATSVVQPAMWGFKITANDNVMAIPSNTTFAITYSGPRQVKHCLLYHQKVWLKVLWVIEFQKMRKSKQVFLESITKQS